uniref:Uncharacterized protein n=2 Tax=Oryza TaxID=4527 RepID=A0A0E0H554_ORYNI
MVARSRALPADPDVHVSSDAKRTASAARVAAVEAADDEHEVDSERREGCEGNEEDHRHCRSIIGEGDEESRLFRCRSIASVADSSPPPPLAALSLSCRSASVPSRPGRAALWEDAEEAIPVPVVVTKLLSPSSSSSPSPLNASLDCVARLKSGERRVPQPRDALHHRESVQMEKRTFVGEGTTRDALNMPLPSRR